MTRRAAWAAACALAAIGALVPLPASFVERWYSRGIFPRLQHTLTGASNLVPFALFDAIWIGAAAAAAVLSYRNIRAYGWARGGARAAGDLAKAAVVLYLVFLATWGLNYRRVPLIDKLRFDPRRVTPAAHSALGEWSVAELNAEYLSAHAAPFSTPALSGAFEDALRGLGGPSAVPGRPKPTLLGWYFHQTAITGMTDPFLLETLLAPDLFDVERPFVVAHEWAHLAGYADESDANFVAYVACRRGDAAARYSAALMTFEYTSHGLTPSKRRLDLGPRSDLFALQRRYAHTSAALRVAARAGYDKYLKANGVAKGVESYDAVVQLILGTEFDSNGHPVLRGKE